jgi:hypothetical protein
MKGGIWERGTQNCQKKIRVARLNALPETGDVERWHLEG